MITNAKNSDALTLSEHWINSILSCLSINRNAINLCFDNICPGKEGSF